MEICLSIPFLSIDKNTLFSVSHIIISSVSNVEKNQLLVFECYRIFECP